MKKHPRGTSRSGWSWSVPLTHLQRDTYRVRSFVVAFMRLFVTVRNTQRRRIVFGNARLGVCVLACFVILETGCRRVERVDVPPYDPDASAEAAMAEYDRNNDGQLSKDELRACPGILAALKWIDLNGDGQVSSEEIADRIRAYIDRGAGLKMVGCLIYLDHKPLVGADVKLVPEPFLAGLVETAEGTSGRGGNAALRIPSELLPQSMAGFPGVRLGVYKVFVSHPDLHLPDRYVSGKELGAEVGPATRRLVFQLNSK